MLFIVNQKVLNKFFRPELNRGCAYESKAIRNAPEHEVFSCQVEELFIKI